MSPRRFSGSAAVWALLIAYASLYPFLPLRPPAPESVAAFFSVPRYVVRSDIFYNVAAYVPLGTLLCLAFRRRAARFAIPKAVALAAALSLAMEVLQLFIPNRVSTAWDIAANAAGAALGALAFAEPLHSLATRRLAALREELVIPGAWGDAGLVLVGLWLLAQLNPALPFFGAGDVAREAGEQLQLLRWSAVGLSICGFGLFVSALLRIEQGSLRATLVLLTVALWLKFLMSGLVMQPHFSADWVSTGRVLGMAGGLAAFVPLRLLARTGRIYLAVLLILAGALFSKIFGAYSPVEELLRIFRWPHGQLATFATLTRFLHELWPLGAVAFLTGLFIRGRRHPVR